MRLDSVLLLHPLCCTRYKRIGRKRHASVVTGMQGEYNLRSLHWRKKLFVILLVVMFETQHKIRQMRHFVELQRSQYLCFYNGQRLFSHSSKTGLCVQKEDITEESQPNKKIPPGRSHDLHLKSTKVNITRQVENRTQKRKFLED